VAGTTLGFMAGFALLGLGLIVVAISKGSLIPRMPFFRPSGKVDLSRSGRAWLAALGCVCLFFAGIVLVSANSPSSGTATSVAHTATSNPGPAVAPTTSSGSVSADSSGISGSTEMPVSQYLADSHPVDGLSGYAGRVSATMNGTAYDHSVIIACTAAGGSPPVEWDVANYTQIDVTVGIDDDSSGASGASADVSFSNQDGAPLNAKATVSIGHSSKLSFGIRGAVRLNVTCASRDLVDSHRIRNFEVVLGDARISR
jgi:hypothetical protein